MAVTFTELDRRSNDDDDALSSFLKSYLLGHTRGCKSFLCHFRTTFGNKTSIFHIWYAYFSLWFTIGPKFMPTQTCMLSFTLMHSYSWDCRSRSRAMGLLHKNRESQFHTNLGPLLTSLNIHLLDFLHVKLLVSHLTHSKLSCSQL